MFELPDSSLTEDSKQRLTQELKDIYPGNEEVVQFSARLLGKENDLKLVHAWLSYTPKNLSARYESTTTFTTKLTVVPVTLTFDMPSRIEQGKEITYEVNYFSNIDYPLENLSVKIDPVNGFNFESAEPASLDDTEWKLDTLSKSQGGRITVKGLVTGDTGNRLNFMARLGMWQDGVFVVMKEASQEIEVIQPMLFISQQINSSSNYAATLGENLRYEIFIRNVGTSSFDDIFITSRIDGAAFDLATLKSSSGQVMSNNNLIIWDSKQVVSLRRLLPAQEVKVEFDVKLKDNWAPADSQKNNTMLKNTVNASNISQEFTTKVNSKLELAQTITDAGSSRQISWQVKNYLNDAKNVKVKAVLPANVTLDDVLSPEEQAVNFSFDSKSREIVWSVGDVAAGVGVTSAPLVLSFQVLAPPGIPSASIISQSVIMGEDQFTGDQIQYPAIIQ